ncbi:hypothetical protein [Nocardia sp. BMG111209]|nr:hypothetical protein [Nocardia sp. BMG111209]
MLTILILLLVVAATGACLDHRRTETTEADRDSARIAAELRAITGLREHG